MSCFPVTRKKGEKVRKKEKEAPTQLRHLKVKGGGPGPDRTRRRKKERRGSSRPAFRGERKGKEKRHTAGTESVETHMLAEKEEGRGAAPKSYRKGRKRPHPGGPEIPGLGFGPGAEKGRNLRFASERERKGKKGKKDLVPRHGPSSDRQREKINRTQHGYATHRRRHDLQDRTRCPRRWLEGGKKGKKRVHPLFPLPGKKRKGEGPPCPPVRDVRTLFSGNSLVKEGTEP